MSTDVLGDLDSLFYLIVRHVEWIGVYQTNGRFMGTEIICLSNSLLNESAPDYSAYHSYPSRAKIFLSCKSILYNTERLVYYLIRIYGNFKNVFDLHPSGIDEIMHNRESQTNNRKGKRQTMEERVNET